MQKIFFRKIKLSEIEEAQRLYTEWFPAAKNTPAWTELKVLLEGGKIVGFAEMRNIPFITVLGGESNRSTRDMCYSMLANTEETCLAGFGVLVPKTNESFIKCLEEHFGLESDNDHKLFFVQRI